MAICIRERIPSCIRAPPEEQKITIPQSSSLARSARRATFSPTTDPMEPPINSKSITPTMAGCPRTFPFPPTRASLLWVLRWVSFTRSGYFIRSLNCRGSRGSKSGIEFHKAAFIDHQVQTVRRGDAKVIIALGADHQIAFYLSAVENLLAGIALSPVLTLAFHSFHSSTLHPWRDSSLSPVSPPAFLRLGFKCYSYHRFIGLSTSNSAFPVLLNLFCPKCQDFVTPLLPALLPVQV